MAADPLAAVTLTSLFIYVQVQQPPPPHTHSYVYGRNVASELRSNENYSNGGRIAV